MRDALLILRTPFQAWLARHVLQLEEIESYDLIYITQKNSEEDRYYFSELNQKAHTSQYVYSPTKIFDILNHIEFRYQLRDFFKNIGYRKVILASLDSFIINAIAIRQEPSLIITIDDGTANINKLASYHQEPTAIRYMLYKKFFGAVPLSSFKEKITRHYTIYNGLENIVDRFRIRTITGWARTSKEGKTLGARTYFIGQPFHLIAGNSYASLMERSLIDQQIDAYVRHPQEIKPLDIGVPFLDKKGRIAEEAIIEDAAGREIHLISGFSSAILNLATIAKSATVLLGSELDTGRLTEYERLAKLFGCRVCRI